MSRRRGHTSVEKNEIERGEWYEKIERQVFPGDSDVFAKQDAVQAKRKEDESIDYPKSDHSYFKERDKLIVKMNETTPTCYSFIFCFHGVGNSHSYFKRWASVLQAMNTKLYGVCLKGRMHRISEDYSGIDCKTIANEVFAAIRSVFLFDKTEQWDKDGPTPNLVLFGHDLGAYVAFETMRLLQCNGLADVFRLQLIVSSAVSPEYITEVNERRLEREATYKREKYIDPYNDRINGPELERDSERSWKELVDKLTEAGHIDRRFADRKDLIKQVLPLITADYALLESYQLKPPDTDDFSYEDSQSSDRTLIKQPQTLRLGVNIRTVCAEDDDLLNREQIEGWAKCTSASCDHMVPLEMGGRNYLLQDENQWVFKEIFENLNYA